MFSNGTTGLRHLRSEVIFDQLSIEKSSNSNSKTSGEIQTALHRPPLLMSTQIPDRSPKLHLVQRVHRLDGTSQFRIFRSAVSSGRLFHSPSSTHTSPLRQSQIYSSVIEWHNGQTLFSSQRKQISCLFFDPQTRVKEKPLGVWSERIYQCFSQQNRSCQTLTIYRRKWFIKNSPIQCRMSCPFVSLPLSPTWDGIHIISTSTPSSNRSIHICLHS
jgi:hypothetical protein